MTTCFDPHDKAINRKMYPQPPAKEKEYMKYLNAVCWFAIGFSAVYFSVHLIVWAVR